MKKKTTAQTSANSQTSETNATNEATVQETISVIPAQKSQSELIAEAQKYGISVEGMDLMPVHVFDSYIRKQLTQQIEAKISEHLGEVFKSIDTKLCEISALKSIVQLCKDNGIKSLVVTVGDEFLQVKRTLREKSDIPAGERRKRSGKFQFTNGSIVCDSLTEMLQTFDNTFTGGVNGAGVINKLKKLTNLDEWNAVNTETNESEPFPVWAKLNVSNCPTI